MGEDNQPRDSEASSGQVSAPEMVTRHLMLQAGVRILSKVHQARQARDLGAQDQDDHREVQGPAQLRGPGNNTVSGLTSHFRGPDDDVDDDVDDDDDDAGPPHARGVYQVHPGQTQSKQETD